MKPVMPLRALVPGQLWHAEQPLKFGPITLTTRMTVVRLSDGALWCHSPIAATPELRSALSSLGVVRYVIAPNRSHHLFFLPFLEAHPSAEGFIAPGLQSKRPDLKHYPEIPGAPPWRSELQAYFIEGLPIINETVWFHASTGTLVLTDLLFCFGAENTGITRIVARLLGVYGQPGMSRTMKFAIRDRQAFSSSVRPLLSLPVTRLILAHDQVIEDQPQELFQRAFQWLR